MQIFHSQEPDSEPLIISIPIIRLEFSEMLIVNQFIEKLNPAEWRKTKNDDTKICFNSEANLNSISLMDDFQKFFTDYYWYKGSLTRPPCTEGVDWFISQKAMELSSDQFLELADQTYDIWKYPLGNKRFVKK